MTHTGKSNPKEIIQNRACGYEFTNSNVLENRDPMQPTARKGAGTLVSTLAEIKNTPHGKPPSAIRS